MTSHLIRYVKDILICLITSVYSREYWCLNLYIDLNNFIRYAIGLKWSWKDLSRQSRAFEKENWKFEGERFKQWTSN